MEQVRAVLNTWLTTEIIKINLNRSRSGKSRTQQPNNIFKIAE